MMKTECFRMNGQRSVLKFRIDVFHVFGVHGSNQ